jgi:hypothetical protein
MVTTATVISRDISLSQVLFTWGSRAQTRLTGPRVATKMPQWRPRARTTIKRKSWRCVTVSGHLNKTAALHSLVSPTFSF